MKSHTPTLDLRTSLLLTMFGTLMFVSQVIMASLPNIEIVSLLIILTTCFFGAKALISVYIFVACELLTYGIGIWSVNYLYVWAVLWVTVFLVRKADSALLFAIISAIFGLCFDVFCSLPYFLTGGIAAGMGYIIAGIKFDIIHAVGNFALTLCLYTPLKKALKKILKEN